MTKKEVEKYLNKKKLFNSAQVSRLGHGNNYDVFLIKDKNKKYTLRVVRQKSYSENFLYNQYIYLKFLESEKARFAPKAIYYDKINKILIASFIPGEKITYRGLKAKEFEKFVRILVKTHNISFLNFKKFCKKNKFKINYPEKPLKNFKIYALDRFDYVIKNCPDKDVIKWIEPKLKENYKFIKNINWNKCKVIFNHSDLTGANIYIDKGKIYFIDWDQARFMYAYDYGFPYMILHFDFFNRNQKKLISLYARYAKINKEKLEKSVHLGLQSVKVNDVIWAAMAYSSLYKNKERGWKKYKKMTYQRMKEYEKMFGK